MLQGKRISLRVAEKDDVPTLVEWFNSSEFSGEYQNFPVQLTAFEVEKRLTEHKQHGHEWVDFIVCKKDGAKIGWACHYVSAPNFGWTEIGYAIIPTERGKGYGTEAIQILVDYLFLTREVVKVQAVVNVENAASQRVLEKTGFRREGTLRKALWDSKGRWANGYLYSVLREEWKQPNASTKPLGGGK